MYLDDSEVSIDLLKYYVINEIEKTGDMSEGIMIFKYKDIEIVGKYNDGDYPAEIISINGEL